MSTHCRKVTGGQFDHEPIATIEVMDENNQPQQALLCLRHSMREANELFAIREGVPTQLTHENDNIYSQIERSTVVPRWQTTSDGKQMLTWIVPLNLEGGLSTAKYRHYIKEIPQEKGLGLMLLNRTYLKIRTSSEIMIGLVTIGDKNITFTFSNNTQSPVDEDNYNDNMISVNGKIIAMPPVLITHPFGISKKWIAQDTEGMVDLTFNPISVNSRTLNIVLMRNAYTTIYGTFEGVLVSDDVEKIVLKNCPGIVKKSHIRL